MLPLRRPHQPWLALSPMDGVTDSPMRQITKKYGRVDLLTSEFMNVEGLHFARKRLEQELEFSATEQPLLLQIYGLKPEFFVEATKLGLAKGFTGIDLNFGCPAKTVVSSGAGAGLINNPELAREIFLAVRATTRTWASENDVEEPSVSIKTRIGYHQPTPTEWLSFLLKLKPDLITVHARTLKQGYTGTADWEAIALAVKLRDQLSPTTAIFGNGDIDSLASAQQRLQQTGADGVTIGRAAMGNPWVFTGHEPTPQERLQVALEHARLYERTFASREKYHFAPMRKHLAAYLKGFVGASELRRQIVTTNSAQEVAEILAQFKPSPETR